MTLHFYKQSATPNRVDKSGFLNDVGEITNVILKETTNSLTPDFILTKNDIVLNSNYFFCEMTSRYYYIQSVDYVSGGRMIIHAKVDVLMTFRNEILNSSGWVNVSDKSTDISDNYDMLHNDYPFRQDYDILGKSAESTIFGSGGTATHQIIMIMK